MTRLHTRAVGQHKTTSCTHPHVVDAYSHGYCTHVNSLRGESRYGANICVCNSEVHTCDKMTMTSRLLSFLASMTARLSIQFRPWEHLSRPIHIKCSTQNHNMWESSDSKARRNFYVLDVVKYAVGNKTLTDSCRQSHTCAAVGVAGNVYLPHEDVGILRDSWQTSAT